MHCRPLYGEMQVTRRTAERRLWNMDIAATMTMKARERRFAYIAIRRRVSPVYYLLIDASRYSRIK